MSRYGINYYGLSIYGGDTLVSYSANNFKATSVGYKTIKLTWTSPTGAWSKIKLVRNTYGFPVNELDGVQLDLQNDGLYQAYKETDPAKYTDSPLSENSFFYYSLFIFDRVNFKWTRAANAIGLSVKDYDFADNLYAYLPEIYKASTVNEGSSTVFNLTDQNTTLYQFLALFGFQLSQYQTMANLIVNRYDTTKISGLLLQPLLQELSIAYEPEIGYQQNRVLARSASELYKSKGTSDGLKEFLKAFTGWSVPSLNSSAANSPVNGVQVGHNLMLDYNDSSFEESVGHWASNDLTALASVMRSRNVTYVSASGTTATVTVPNHNYKVGNKAYITGSDKPLFNSTSSTPITITAVTSTTISFTISVSITLPTTNAWNFTTQAYPIIYPYPVAWNEPTALTLYPNRQQGIMAVTNAGSSAQTIKLQCGATKPVTKGIPVTAGLSYIFSIYTTNSSTSRNVQVGIRWYDRFSVQIGSDAYGTALASGTGAFSVRPSYTGTAPTGATYAVPLISIASAAGSASNEYQYFDAAQFEQASTITAFDDARQLHITLKANRINELVNPSFNLISGTTSSPVVTPWTTSGGGATTTLTNLTQQPGTTKWDVVYKTITSNVVRLETKYTHDHNIADKIVVNDMGAPYDGVWTVTAIGERTTYNNAYVEYSITGSNPNVTRTAVTPYLIGSYLATPKMYTAGQAYSVLATSTTTKTIKSWDGSTNSQLMPIYYPNLSYTFSVYAAIDRLYPSSAETVTPYIKWYDSSYTLISTTTGTVTSGNVTAYADVWNRLIVTDVSPSNVAYAEVGVTWTPTVVNQVVYFDYALFESSSLPFDYFDGSSGYGTSTDYLWEGGTASAGRSHYYKNRFAVQSRIGNSTFVDQLPLGSTVAIYLAQPNT
jgi:hypothetical protein